MNEVGTIGASPTQAQSASAQTVPSPSNKSLETAIESGFNTVEQYSSTFAQPDLHNNNFGTKRANRARVWAAVVDITRRHTDEETPTLRTAIRELKEFQYLKMPCQDEGGMRQIWEGYKDGFGGDPSKSRPGLRDLLQNVFSAAGLGQIDPQG